MPSVFLSIENYWFEIPSDTYVVHLADAYGPYCILGFLQNSADTWLLGDVFFRNFYATFDDALGEVTLSPRNNSGVFQIPRNSPLLPPANTTAPTIRNYTTAYTTGMSSAFIGLYTIISLMGAEGVTLGVLFGLGYLVIKKKASLKQYEDEKKLRSSAAEFDVNSSTSSLLGDLRLNGSQPIVIIKLE